MARMNLCNALPPVLLAAVGLALPAAASAQNLVVNGGFETGNFFGWTVQLAPSGSQLDIGNPGHSGNHEAYFASTGLDDRISQVIPTVAGERYRLSFWMRNFDQGQDRLAAFWEGSYVYQQSPVPFNNDNSWVEVVLEVVATTNGSQLILGGYDVPGQVSIDDVSVSVVSLNNDACASAIDVSAGGTFNGTLAGATQDGPPPCGFLAGAPDVWYRYTAGATAVSLTVSTCGTSDMGGVDAGMDTVLSLHETCGGAPIACNDDTEDFCGMDAGYLLDSALRLVVAAGESVLIRVSKMGGDAGPFVLHVAGVVVPVAPAGDTCATATPVVSGGTYVATLEGASADGQAGCGGSNNNADLWYAFTAPAGNSGRLSVNTCGSSGEFLADTVISLYSACGQEELACNDDVSQPGNDCGDRDSAAQAIVAASSVTLIRVSHFDSSVATQFRLNVNYQAFETPNGSFETGPGSLGVLQAGSAAIDNWTVTRGSVDWVDLWQAGDGSRSIDLQGLGSSGGVKQTIATVPGQRYRLTFALSANPDGLPNIKHMRARAGNDSQDFAADRAGRTHANMMWSDESMVFVAAGEQTEIELYSIDAPGSFGAVIDNVRVTEEAPPPPCRADFNGDGLVFPDDLSEYITCFFQQVQSPGFCPRADFNQDGLTFPDDLSEFITIFFLTIQAGGC